MNYSKEWEEAVLKNTFDVWVLTLIKLYYWPMFLIGNGDNIAAIFNPKTYSICRV
jgi:hypothetical protein